MDQVAPRKMLMTTCRNASFALSFFTPGRSGHGDSLDSCCTRSREGKEENFRCHQTDKKKAACERGEGREDLRNLT